MPLSKKILALTLGAVASLSAATFAQPQGPAPRGSSDTLVVDDATVDWILKSDVSALTDGVVEQIELDIGKVAPQKGARIGTLYSKKAELLVEKAKVAAGSKGAIAKAKAQVEKAKSVVSRNNKMLKVDRLSVSVEDQERDLAELNVAQAFLTEAHESLSLAAAEQKLAEQQLEEHTIRAPFPGVIYERIKNPGESVRSGDPVVKMGNLDKLRVYAYIPVEYRDRVQEGAAVEIRPKGSGGLSSGAGIDGMVFRGAVTFIDPQIQPNGETAVRIYADFPNQNHALKPGLKTSMTIQLDPGAARNPANANVNAAPPRAIGEALPELPPATAVGNAPQLPPSPR